jgi:DedD protein
MRRTINAQNSSVIKGSMAWFKFGKQDDKVRTTGPTESVDAMRKRALMRLIGAVVLVLGAVVGFPLLFDSQPRSVPVDVPIEIPDKTKVKPLPLPAGAPLATTPAPSARIDDTASLSGKEEIVKPAKTTDETPAKNTDKPTVTPDNTAQPAIRNVAPGSAATQATPPVTDDAARAKAAADKAAADKAKADKAKADKDKADKAKADKAKADKAALDASRAKALLDGQAAEAKVADAKPDAAAGERYIVQFGAFTDVAKSREVRQKVEKAGLKTYSQVAKTATGDLIRVRVGPFASRAEADKAAAKIKTLNLPASVLTL